MLRIPGRKFKQLHLATFNVRTLKDHEKVEELKHELEEAKLKWDILGLSETRRHEQLIQLRSGKVLYTRGGVESVGGVGFLVSKNIEDRI